MLSCVLALVIPCPILGDEPDPGWAPGPVSEERAVLICELVRELRNRTHAEEETVSLFLP